MTLRTVHLIFILAAIVFAEMFGAWAIFHYPTSGDVVSLWLGIATLLGGLALCGYAIHFVRKMDSAGIE